MVSPLGMGLDFIQREPCRLKLLVGIEPGLIEVVWRRRVAVLAKDQDRSRFYLRTEVDDAYEGVSRNSVAPLLSLFGTSVEIENHAEPTRRSGNRETGLAIAKGLVAQRISPLHPVDL